MTVNMTVNTSIGKITANKVVLNAISIAFLKAADKFNDEGANALARRYKRVSDEIYKELKNDMFYSKYYQIEKPLTSR